MKEEFKITEKEVEEIANENDTLKTDFLRNSKRNGITYLKFEDNEIELIEVNLKKYYQFQVVKGKISWMETNNGNTSFYDGFFTEEDLKYLRCLIDPKTGDYIYYPNLPYYKKRVVKKENSDQEEKYHSRRIESYKREE
ncbi:MAG: hypothetical protein IKE70_01405 [Bacilli bacterium]|nr:hypothetical protein [Bacilli bacterium]